MSDDLTGDRYAEWDERVYESEYDDSRVRSPLVRALHGELCRGPHAGNAIPACERAFMCVKKFRYHSDAAARAVLDGEQSAE